MFYFVLQIWKITNIIALKMIHIKETYKRTSKYKKIHIMRYISYSGETTNIVYEYKGSIVYEYKGRKFMLQKNNNLSYIKNINLMFSKVIFFSKF